MYEVLNGSDYDFFVWNGDTDRSIIFRIGTIGSTPELQLKNDSVFSWFIWILHTPQYQQVKEFY